MHDADDLTPDPVLFTVSNVVISDAFPADIQSLAGSIFNEIAQLGNSVGLTITVSIAASVTEHHAGAAAGEELQARMQGYRAAFWTIFSGTTLVTVVAFVGLRKVGTIGRKSD